MLNLIRKIFIIAIIVFFSGILLSVIGLAVFLNFTDPNQYKKSVMNMLEKAVHRKAEIQGSLHWTIYPALGVQINQLSLSNLENFSPENPLFLSVRQAKVSIAFLPLLKKQIKIHEIILDHLSLNLIKNREQQVNWQINNLDNINSENTAKNKVKKFALFTLTEFKLSRLIVKNSDITYQDQWQKKTIVLKNLTLAAQDILFNQLFPLQTNFDFIFNTDNFSQTVNVNLNAQAVILKNRQQFRLEKIHAQTDQYQWQGFMAWDFSEKNLSALDGNLTVSAADGIFHGIDFPYYSHVAEALIQKKKSDRQNTYQTPFKKLQGNFDIHHGIVHTQDFLLELPELDVTGEGKINLAARWLNYRLSLQRLTNGSQIKPRGPAIPIIITGELSHPAIRPDWESFLLAEIKSQTSEKITEKITEKIQQSLSVFLGN